MLFGCAVDLSVRPVNDLLHSILVFAVRHPKPRQLRVFNCCGILNQSAPETRTGRDPTISEPLTGRLLLQELFCA
jgi:hypothetical protein